MNDTLQITQAEIAGGLRALGLRPGQQVLAHTSLSSLGHVVGGADALIDAIRDVIGPGGTLLAPTLTGSEALSAANPPIFDPVATSCWTGRVPETLRRRPDALRSLHPTHSVAAVGADAAALLAGHGNSITPCDEHSPYGKLAQSPMGAILLIGVGHESNTTLHHVEEVVGVPYHMQPGLVAARMIDRGAATVRHVMLHQYGAERDFAVIEPLLIERGIQQTATIGRATVRLIAAQPLVAVVAAALRADTRLLCRRS